MIFIRDVEKSLDRVEVMGLRQHFHVRDRVCDSRHAERKRREKCAKGFFHGCRDQRIGALFTLCHGYELERKLTYACSNCYRQNRYNLRPISIPSFQECNL